MTNTDRTLTLTTARLIDGTWYAGTEHGHDLRTAYRRVQELTMMYPGRLAAEVWRGSAEIAQYDSESGWSK
jgi:hypothetical protein